MNNVTKDSVRLDDDYIADLFFKQIAAVTKKAQANLRRLY